MIDLKPYGGFIEYTIRPLIEKLKELGFEINESIIKEFIRLHIISKLIDATVSIITISIVSFAVYTIAK